MEFEKIKIGENYILCRSCESNFRVGDTVKVIDMRKDCKNYNVLIETIVSRTWVNNNWLEDPLNVVNAIDFYPGEVVKVSWAHACYPGAIAVVDHIYSCSNRVMCILPNENDTKLSLYPCEIIKDICINNAEMEMIGRWQARRKAEEEIHDDILFGINRKELIKGCVSSAKRTLNAMYGLSTSKEYGIKSIQIFEEKKIVTVVFADNKIKVVRCAEGDNFDPNIGVALAIAEHLYGSKTKFRKFVNARAKRR